MGKVHIDEDEYWPFRSVRTGNDGVCAVEVDEEILKRWDSAMTQFKSVQYEMSVVHRLSFEAWRRGETDYRVTEDMLGAKIGGEVSPERGK